MWNIVHYTRYVCSSDSDFLPDGICTAVDWFYQLSIENAISEELFSELLGPEMCETNVSDDDFNCSRHVLCNS